MSDEDLLDTFTLTITEDHRQNYKRLDQLLADELKDISRTALKSLFDKGWIQIHQDSPIQGKCELKKLPQTGTIIEVQVPPPMESSAKPQNIPLEILFEDSHLAIIVKPAGMVTHPAPGNPDGTLVNAILFHCPDLQGIGDEKRPGIVHRLDKGTSGVMVVAKNQKSHEGLVQLFAAHNITRRYQCLALNRRVPDEGTLHSTIGRHPSNRKKMAAEVRGKEAITHYKILESFDNIQHMQMTLETGRTHQIRVHLSQLLNAPILMDELYGSPKNHLKAIPLALQAHLKNYPYPLLHARVLGFVHPITKEELYFEVEPPEVFQKSLDILRGEQK